VKRKPPRAFDTFCREALDFLSSASTPYLLIGGLAVIAIGRPRTTSDVDVIGNLALEQAPTLIDVGVVAGSEVAPDERERLDRRESCDSGRGSSKELGAKANDGSDDPGAPCGASSSPSIFAPACSGRSTDSRFPAWNTASTA
jgi:hypothetical protein